jgi:penicillin V acylase-like amidase (Ntn superfamily)
MSMNGALDQNPAKWSSKYGSIVIEVSNYDNAGVDGMNEKGLTARLLYLEATKYKDRDERPGVSYLHWLHYVLDDAATVSKALSSFVVGKSYCCGD